MLFPTSAYLPLLAILPSFTSASLHPWEITRLAVSGLPWRGDEDLHRPLNTLAVEVRDRNAYADPEALVQCITKFPYASPPYHDVFNCTEVPYGRWDFAFFPPSPPRDNEETRYWNPGQNFTLELRLFLTSGASWFRSQVNFSVSPGGNMRGLCSAGGVCSFTAKEELLPIYVQQTEGGDLGG